ncbi:hypothetical protein B296_00011657, partial [Ensete ventricosum]
LREQEERKRMKALWVVPLCFLCLLFTLGRAADSHLWRRPGGFGLGVVGSNAFPPSPPTLVNLTLVPSAAAKGADFYNWNRVQIRYCDGASFAGEGHDAVSKIRCAGLLVVLKKKKFAPSCGRDY